MKMVDAVGWWKACDPFAQKIALEFLDAAIRDTDKKIKETSDSEYREVLASVTTALVCLKTLGRVAKGNAS